MALLAQRHTVVVPDLRGAGGSAKPAGGYDKKSMAVDIHALTAALTCVRAAGNANHTGGLESALFEPWKVERFCYGFP
jgi:hypothetical protein